jgi:hypothetical protein
MIRAQNPDRQHLPGDPRQNLYAVQQSLAPHRHKRNAQVSIFSGRDVLKYLLVGDVHPSGVLGDIEPGACNRAINRNIEGALGICARRGREKDLGEVKVNLVVALRQGDRITEGPHATGVIERLIERAENLGVRPGECLAAGEVTVAEPHAPGSVQIGRIRQAGSNVHAR